MIIRDFSLWGTILSGFWGGFQSRLLILRQSRPQGFQWHIWADCGDSMPAFPI